MKLRITLAILSILSLVFVACENKIPVKELAKAKGAIAMAESVNADKYSPEEMKAAKAELVKAHDVIIKDEKPEESVKMRKQLTPRLWRLTTGLPCFMHQMP